MKLLILGAGGYGQVAKEVAQNSYSYIEFLDDNSELAIGKINELEKFRDYKNAFIAIGNPKIRKELFEKCESVGFSMISLISDKAYISPSAMIDKGCIIEPMAVINANSTINKGTLVCAGAIINHNAVVNDFCQIDCGAVVGAGCVVPSGTHLYYNDVEYKNNKV